MALTVEDVRDYINDYPDANELLDEVEFSNRRINKAIKFVVADFNETPVLTQYSVEDFPFIATLLYGTAAHLFRGEAAKQERNHLPHSTGGLSIDESNKFAQYMQLSDFHMKKYEKKVREVKNSLNLNQGWSDIQSEYSNLPII